MFHIEQLYHTTLKLIIDDENLPKNEYKLIEMSYSWSKVNVEGTRMSADTEAHAYGWTTGCSKAKAANYLAPKSIKKKKYR